VNRFALLLDSLVFTPSRLGKLRLIADYFATSGDPERGWALAALTGELTFRAVKPQQIRALVMSRVDAELFAWSYDFVGDLAETVSLIWPSKPGVNYQPDLTEIVEELRLTTRDAAGERLTRWLDALDGGDRGGVARAGAALHRALRLAAGPCAAAAHRRPPDLHAADARPAA
jgi:DNA ligase-1